MRHRVSEFQKVLNRAKTEAAVTERKTVRSAYMIPVVCVPTSLRAHLAFSFQWKKYDLTVIVLHAARLDDSIPVLGYTSMNTSCLRPQTIRKCYIEINMVGYLSQDAKPSAGYRNEQIYYKRSTLQKAKGRERWKKRKVAVVYSTKSRASAWVARISGFQDRLGNFRRFASYHNLAL